VGVRETLLGVIAVGVLAGLVVGRHTERIRRNYKDLGTAKAAVPKARSIYTGSIRSGTGRILAWAALVILAIYVFTKLPSAGS
jgi:hypothetical protein